MDLHHALYSFISTITSNGKLPEAVRKFHQYQQDENTTDMFKCIYKMEEAHTFLKLHIQNDCKNGKLSIKLREEGNVFYKEKQLKDALEKYNKCIFSAPHPKLHCKKVDTNEYNPLAMGYGNRSALLFRLREYEMCICDIDRSIHLCIPKNTQFKLEQRKVQCLIAMEKYEEAQDLLKKSEILLDTLQNVKECEKSALSNLVQQCAQGLMGGQIRNKKQKSKYEVIKSANASTSFSNDDLIFAYNNPRPPSLDDEPNPTIPAFSCALKLQYSPDQGRYVVATRDIKPGEVIAVETAYSSCLKPEEPNSPFSFCTFCLARCAAPIPCPECTKVVFCNEGCRSKGLDKFHMKECPVYSNLLEYDRDVIISYRTIAGKSIDELKVFVSQFQKEEHKSPLEQLLNEDQICDSDSYRGFYFLDVNIKSVKFMKLFDYSVLAFMLTHLLIQSNRFFVTNTGDKYVPDEEDIAFIGSLLIRHLLACSCNSYDNVENHVNPNENTSFNQKKVGAVTFIALSMFNHSCNPSAMPLAYGNAVVCRAIHFIPSGSQVFINYIAPYYEEPNRETRRKILSDTYLFNCKCDACVNDYRFSIRSLEEDYSGSMLLSTIEKRTSRTYWELERTDSLSELEALYKRIMPKLEIPAQHSELNVYLEAIEFYDRNVVGPDLFYIMLEDEIRLIFSLESSCNFIN
ncbi:unnamed protein product, partial [Meganyctiphanes norvegica]